jgi:WD40 repeat protein
LIGVAAALAAVAAAGWWKAVRVSPPAPRQATRFTLTLPPEAIVPTDVGPWYSVAVSKDGRTIAWVTGGEHSRVFLRRLGDPAVVPLAGTDGALKVFFSPDAESVAFYAGGQLKRIATAGGAPVPVIDAPWEVSGAWGDDNMIVLGGRNGLLQVPVTGGTPQQIVGLRPGEREYSNPQWLPGSRNVLFTIEPDNVASFDDAKIAVVAPGGQPKVLIEGGAVPFYVPTGHIVYVRGGSVMAVPFDAERLVTTGKPRTVTAGGLFNQFSAEALFAVSPSGTFVYAPDGPVARTERRITFFDRRGTETTLTAPANFYADPALSPDGRSLSLTIRAANDDTWVYDLDRSALTRLTTTLGDSQHGAWSPDGARVVYWNERSNGAGLYWRATDGSSEERLTTASGAQQAGNFTPDGASLVYTEERPGTSGDIYVLDVKSRQTKPLLTTQFDERCPRFSPDGKWLAYMSEEGGEPEVFVVPYPGPGRKVRVSVGGGHFPSWRGDGREILFRGRDAVMSADVTPSGTSLQVGLPKELFRLPDDVRDWLSISADGQRILTTRGPRLKTVDSFTVVTDWLDELAQLAPAIPR